MNKNSILEQFEQHKKILIEIPQTITAQLSNAYFAGLEDLFYHLCEIHWASLAWSFVHGLVHGLLMTYAKPCCCEEFAASPEPGFPL